jgi:hypothetical protein
MGSIASSIFLLSISLAFNPQTKTGMNKTLRFTPIFSFRFSVCEEVLKYPVTNLCGHTFCRECCFGRTKCNVCDQNFPIINTLSQSKHEQPACSTSYLNSNASSNVKSSTITTEILSLKNECVGKEFYQSIDKFNNNDTCRCGGFEQDILIRKLVEKWWTPLLKVSESNKEAEQYLERNLLDEALKSCNESLLKCKYFFIICHIEKQLKLIILKQFIILEHKIAT